MKYRDIIIYGGTSEISLELVKLYLPICQKIIIFCRNQNNLKKFLNNNEYIDNSFKNKIKIFEADLQNLEENLKLLNELNNEISGIFWLAGFTGDSENEYSNIEYAKKNLEINFLNPALLINEISKKMIKNKNSFISVFTSVAGLRGRKKQLFYSSAKSGLIVYLSGLRQKLSEHNILVTTVIPGYMNTRPFREGKWTSLKILITEPKDVAKIIKRSIEKKKEIIYVNFLWKIIMIIVKIIPEKIFKRLSF